MMFMSGYEWMGWDDGRLDGRTAGWMDGRLDEMDGMYYCIMITLCVRFSLPRFFLYSLFSFNVCSRI